MHNFHHQLFSGVVYHARITPVKNSFRYNVFSLMLNIDDLVHAETTLFKTNRFGIWSFYNRDHGSFKNEPLRPWVEEQLNFKPDKIMLLCFPRLLGYVFNPISVFFCYQDNTLKAVIYEVRNAYKHQHCYIEYVNDAAPHQHIMQKQFYVSPYTPMEGYYKIKLQAPTSQHWDAETPDFHLNINLFDQDHTLILVTHHLAKSQPFTNKNLIIYSIRYSLLPFKISGAILWQALKLRLKGLKFKKP